MSEIEPYEEEDDEPEWAGDPKQMGFLDHLEELGWTLLKPLVVFVVAFFASMIFITDVKDILLAPLESNYSHLTEAERAVVFAGLTTMNVTGVFVAMLLIGIIIGLMVASPVIIYYVGRFLAPALTVRGENPRSGFVCRSCSLPAGLRVWVFLSFAANDYGGDMVQ